MKIVEVNLATAVTHPIGLSAISMKKVGSTILLAGKNGSGKTRILNLIREQAANLHNFVAGQKNAQNQMNSLKGQIKQQSQQKIQFESQVLQHEQARENVKRQIEQQSQQKIQFESQVLEHEQARENVKRQIEQQSQQKAQFESQILQHEQARENVKRQIEQQPQQKAQFESQVQQYEQTIESFKRQIEQQPQQKAQLERQILQHEQARENVKRQIEQQPQQKEQLENQVQQYEQAIENVKSQIEQQPQQKEQLESQLLQQQDILQTPSPIIPDKEQQNITVIDFVPNKIELEDWSSYSKVAWMQKAGQAKSHGISTIHQATIPLIQQVLERWVNTTHQNLQYSKSDKQESTDDYNRLQEIIKSFLGTEIGWDKDGYSTLFKKPIFQAQLSAGQRVLLQLCVAIYAQGGTLSNHIIFMDEPENHLHPSAVIDLLETIRTHNPDGQIWIATHSIPLLSHFDASTLWFVEGGAVKHSGRKPELVLKSLLGNEESIQKLRDFTSLPSELARNRFAFECLCPPEVVETDSKDPQSIQLNEQLKVIWKDKISINLLDFGAGKGRMIANLSDYESVSQETLNYYAYDPYTSDKDDCIRNISLSYEDAKDRYHNSIENIRSNLDDNFFDVIVLSNVLHEIPHTKWCEIFTEIKTLLKDDGYLLIIEDCLIPTGELPHINGFLVLSTLQLKKLFGIPASEKKFIKHDARFDSAEQRGRLMAHLIPNQYLENISSKTIQVALAELKKSAQTEIREIRSGDMTYSNGLAHSFWIQQLANTTLCLSEQGLS